MFPVGSQGGEQMPSKLPTMPLRDKAIAFVILALMLGGFAFAIHQQSLRVIPRKIPKIFVALPVDPVEASAEFRSRILSDFPLLSLEASLVQTLSSEGFVSDGWFSKRMTFRNKHGGSRGCDFTASVSWESDSQSRISVIDARLLRSPGCN